MFSEVHQSAGSERVNGAILRASRATGASFDYLLATAKRESALDPVAEARTSSATGLFQFIDSTWLQMVKEAGPSFGLDEAAAAITRTEDGRYVAADPTARTAILEMRKDPDVSALMAGALTERNREGLEAALGRAPTAGELYVAHFMGLGGAAKLIRLAESNGAEAAADAFPRQAAANPSIFYAPGGRAFGAEEIYRSLAGRFDGAGTEARPEPAETQLASAPAAWLAIPAHNAYAADPAGSRLDRAERRAPVSGDVVALWGRLGKGASRLAPETAERSQAPVAAETARGSFFATLFAVSRGVTGRSGKAMGG